MNALEQLLVIGLVLVLAGIVCIWNGDKEIPVKGGRILRLFSYPKGRTRWAKWLIGGALIYAGFATLFKVFE